MKNFIKSVVLKLDNSVLRLRSKQGADPNYVNGAIKMANRIKEILREEMPEDEKKTLDDAVVKEKEDILKSL